LPSSATNWTGFTFYEKRPVHNEYINCIPKVFSLDLESFLCTFYYCCCIEWTLVFYWSGFCLFILWLLWLLCSTVQIIPVVHCFLSTLSQTAPKHLTTPHFSKKKIYRYTVFVSESCYYLKTVLFLRLFSSRLDINVGFRNAIQKKIYPHQCFILLLEWVMASYPQRHEE
jgi:hypothetical protein